MALTRKEKLWLVILLLAVGLASFWAGRLSLVIEQLQEERPITLVGEQPQPGELEKLIKLSREKQK